ncbi:MAG TPA: outer membrane beta-barrel protein [Blastocatellia bacterium]|nr:outer membrane beta-barrel protein [Blastocatellia bacterium]
MRIMKCLQEKTAEFAEAPGACVLTPYCGSIIRRIATVFPVGAIVFVSTAGVKAQSHSVAGQASRASNEIGQTVASKPGESSKQEREETINSSALIKGLRHLGPTNVSYLAPLCKGLTLQGGIVASLIGYDSLYAKDNFNYTRPWGADFTPYLMMGVNASYPFNDKLTGAVFVVNGYWHLANANSVPSSGGQFAYKASSRVTVKETVLYGPHQSNTSLKFWRFLSDSIVERKTDRVTVAFEYITSTERVDAPGRPRALMIAGQLPVHWALNKRWRASIRPEVFWDRDGRWTLARQTVKAITTTLEYRIPYKETSTILRLEHRWDDSRGPDGGFFRGAEVRPGVIGLTPAQHLLIFGLIFTFDH